MTAYRETAEIDFITHVQGVSLDYTIFVWTPRFPVIGDGIPL
jgi:hypothetical protein